MSSALRLLLTSLLGSVILVSIVTCNQGPLLIKKRQTTAEIVRSKGFIAEDHYVTSKGGYILNVVKCTNPLIKKGKHGLKNKSVVLFVHGSLTSANSFIVKAKGAKPQDYSKYNAAKSNRIALTKLLAKDPSIDSLPFLLLNFGHEVWLLNRRGTTGSLGRSNGRNATIEHVPNGDKLVKNILEKSLFKLVGGLVTKPNHLFSLIHDVAAELIQIGSQDSSSDFWSYSLDDQAKHDLPCVIDYIRKCSKRNKVSLVGHSAGSALILMALAEQPLLAKKVGHAVLWAPSVYLGHGIDNHIESLTTSLTNYIGAFPPLFSLQSIIDLLALVCSNGLSQKTICKSAANSLIAGDSIHQIIQADQIVNLVNAASGRELAQLGQNFFSGGIQHYFDFGTTEQNEEAYGISKPPAYDFAAIKLKHISFMVGKSDGVVAAKDVKLTRDLLSVAADVHVTSGEEGLFDKIGFNHNDNTGTEMCIPSLARLESDC